MVKPIKHGYVDLNGILMAVNIVIASLLAFAFIQAQSNEYVNQDTFLLGIVLAIETHVALFLERKRRDPFVIVLAYITIVYFSLRLFTLSLYPYSIVFERYPYDAHDSNYALVFTIIANVFLYAGLYVVKFKNNLAVSAGSWRPTSPAKAVFLIVAGMIYIYTNFSGDVGGGIGRALGILTLFLNPGLITLMALAYYWLFRKSFRGHSSVALLAIILIDVVVHTLLSSRGAIVGIIQDCSLVILGISGCIKLQKRHAVFALALLPIVAVLLVGAYAISTFNRVNRAAEGGSLSLSQAVKLADETSSRLRGNLDLDTLLPPIFGRVGFFDFSAELIAHSDRYATVVNVPSYAESIVDNILTPGFDLFDQPKISNALQFVYEGLGRPSKKLVSGNYQSDQLGVYGEYYVLFKYASIPFFFLTAFFIKRIYVRLKGPNPFRLAVKRTFVLVSFWTIINSYGIDWTIMNIVPMVAALFLYSLFFTSSRANEPVRSNGDGTVPNIRFHAAG